MPTITCQYTGIQFEAASARTKNHPQVAKFVDMAANDKMKPGCYAKAKELLAEAKGQFDNIDDLMAVVNEAYQSWYQAAPGRKVMSFAEIKAIGHARIRNAYDRDREINDLDEFRSIR